MISTTRTNAYQAAADTSSTSSNTQVVGQQLDKNAFLNLLISQMQNQDPLKPMDDTQFIAQLAQFSSLEQMQQVSSKLDTLTMTIHGSAVTSLIGHTITAQLPDQQDPFTGVVTAVTYDQGVPLLVVGDKTVDPAYVTKIE